MPVYGKGRTDWRKRKALRRSFKNMGLIYRTETGEWFSENPPLKRVRGFFRVFFKPARKKGATKPRKILKRLTTKVAGYKYQYTPLLEVEENIRFPLRKEIRGRIKESMRVAKKGRPVVVDWGCGAGTALTELADEFGDEARFYGFADISHKEWRKNGKVKFIHGTQEDFFRYFKDSSIDIIYSHLGLAHLDIARDQLYLEKLLEKLKPGGKLVCDQAFSLRMAVPGTYNYGSTHFEISHNGSAVVVERKK